MALTPNNRLFWFFQVCAGQSIPWFVVEGGGGGAEKFVSFSGAEFVYYSKRVAKGYIFACPGHTLATTTKRG